MHGPLLKPEAGIDVIVHFCLLIVFSIVGL
jgi:hypothetical protein